MNERAALAIILPIAEARAAHLDAAREGCPWARKARAAVELARATLAQESPARLTWLTQQYREACRVTGTLPLATAPVSIGEAV